MISPTVFAMPCGCIVDYDSERTNDECLVLNLSWCGKHIQVTIDIVEPKAWDERDTGVLNNPEQSAHPSKRR